MEEGNITFFNKGVWKAVVITVGILVVGELFLASQYQRLEKKRVSVIEQKLEAQQQELEKQEAENVLKEFLNVRVKGDETRAVRYLTEGAMQQKEQGIFQLTGDFKDYEIRNVEKIEEHSFRFQVAIFGEAQMLQQLEVIRLTKILEEYYIDSIELAG